ncbi:hypothetical protein JOE56_000583 [Brevibacterium paucivorans]|uniref:VWFA domain-containing protein n=1 Tax=Brevibacterium paucivorans TaxID=170994 RepID=A0ABS2SI10_9MICO|nr:hypothetical protein [Brevibacterium paucivorans]MBM7815889.1 hypothetical protein [Brevibacterium paucivorans]
MTVFMLNRGASVSVNRSRLTLSVTLPSQSDTISVVDTTGAAIDFVAPAPGFVIIPEPPDTFTVSVQSGGQEFPRGSSIFANVKVDATDYTDEDEVRLSEGIDPSGLRSVNILQFTADGGSLRVELPAVSTVAQDLSSSAEAVRVEARRQLGNVDGSSRPVVIALDASASAHTLDAKNVQETLEHIIGYASQITSEGSISGALVSDKYVPVMGSELAELPERMVNELQSAPLRSASVVTSDAFISTLPQDTLVIYVSDSLPVDFERLGNCGVEVKLVVLMSREAWAVESSGVEIPVPATHVDTHALANMPEASRSAALAQFVQALSQRS